METNESEKLPDSFFEDQSNLKYKKGTSVRVTKLDQEYYYYLLKSSNKLMNSEDPELRDAGKYGLQIRGLLKRAIGRVFVVEDYQISGNPHVLNVDGIRIGFPAECLEEVK